MRRVQHHRTVWVGLMSNVTKIVVAGPFGAGKTTFVGSACGQAIGTEWNVSDSSSRLKAQTTVALDHGTVRLPAAPGERTEQVVTLFGTPGQQRFSFMWPMLAAGMHAYVLVLDASRPHSRAQMRYIAQRFTGLRPRVPMVTAVNRWDRHRYSAVDIASQAGVPVESVVACDPRDPHQVRMVLSSLVAAADRRSSARQS